MEIAAGAVGGLGVAVADHAVGRDVVGLHQVRDQAREGLHLGAGRALGVEVAHHADADAVVVEAVVGGLGVGAPFLLGPARADLDQAVGGVGAVADDEMI